MDPRQRADEALARARARGAFVVTPDNATSPMDANTVRIPREVVRSVDERQQQQPTQAIARPGHPQQPGQPPAPHQQQPPRSQAQQEPEQLNWPTENHDQDASRPNRFQAALNPNEFGPAGPQPNVPPDRRAPGR